MDDFGDRMKLLEKSESGRRFLPLLPICVRLDGKNFSKLTQGLERPYDTHFRNKMVETGRYIVEKSNAIIGYVQSDEISLILYSDNYKSQVFFDGRIQKLCSVLASMVSVKFYSLMANSKREMFKNKCASLPVFDCRAWVVPNKTEAVNNLLWREQDCTKNSITMAARCYYSDKQLFGVSGSEKQEMLHKKGINWNDYPNWFKRGTYIKKNIKENKFTKEELDKLPEKHYARKNPDMIFKRSLIEEISIPPLSKMKNRVEFVFENQEPVFY